MNLKNVYFLLDDLSAQGPFLLLRQYISEVVHRYFAFCVKISVHFDAQKQLYLIFARVFRRECVLVNLFHSFNYYRDFLII